MEVQKFHLDVNATVRLKIQDILINKLIEINQFLQFLKQNSPQIFTDAIKILIEDFKYEENFSQIDIDFECKLLDNFPELRRNSINKILALLDYPKYLPLSVDEEIEVKVKDAIKSIHIFPYYLLNCLTSILPLEEAIKVIKEVVDFQVKSSEDSDNYIETMGELYENMLNFQERWKAHDAVIGMIDENTIFCKITKCKWNDIMKELGLDSRVFYSIVCYGDYADRKSVNPGFLLTRTKTLVEGDDMCDFCDHDTRFKKEIIHPTKQFWDNL